jgi:hypothetical protein
MEPLTTFTDAYCIDCGNLEVFRNCESCGLGLCRSCYSADGLCLACMDDDEYYLYPDYSAQGLEAFIDDTTR